MPNPTPPCKNNGLKDTSPPSATLRAAACANSFGLPTTKLSKVYLGSKEAPGRSLDPVLVFFVSVIFFDLFAGAILFSMFTENTKRSTSKPCLENSNLIESP